MAHRVFPSWLSCSFACVHYLLAEYLEQVRINTVVGHKIPKNFTEVFFVLGQHLLWFKQGIITVTEHVHKPSVENAVGVIIILLNTGGEVPEAVEGGGLL